MKNFAFVFLLMFCCLFAVSNSAAQSKEQDEIIKVDTNLVSIPVVVNDRNGKHIPNLKATDFSVFENGAKQQISFFAAEEEPINVVILLDTSKSTQDILGEIQDAADNFIQLLKPTDRAMIATFDYQVNLLSPLTADRQTLERAIDNVDVGEYAGTVMRDAIDEVIHQSLANVTGRKAIILLTDGKDAGSVPTEEELLQDLEESDVIIYSVFYETGGGNNFRAGNRGFGGMGGMRRGNGGFDPKDRIDPRDDRMNRRNGRDDGYGDRRGGIYDDNFPMRRQQERRRQRQGMRNEEAANYLSQMSETTAGRFYESNNTDLTQTFAQIADELKKQYRVGYYPNETTSETAETNDEVRQIKVQVARQNVAVRARSTYRLKK